MNTKLTLTIEQSVIEKAKRYARKKERSLSDLIENYLIAITNNEEPDSKQLTPIVNALKGSVKMPPNFDYKEELNKALSEKYL